MAALDFPASSASPWTAPNGVVYTWNVDGYWEAVGPTATDYLKLDATNGPVTGPLTFEGETIHEGGVSVTGGTVDTPGTIIGNANNSIIAQGQNSSGAIFGFIGGSGAHISVLAQGGTAATRAETISFYTNIAGSTDRSVGYQAYVEDALTATNVEGVSVAGNGWDDITGTGKGISINVPARGSSNWSIHSAGSAPVHFASPFTANGGNNNTDFRILDNGQIRSIPTFNSDNTSDTNLIRITVDGGFQRSTSSRRYKDNIRDCELFSSNAADVLKQIQPRTWEDHNTGETVNGFVAEELYELGGEGMVSFSPWKIAEGEYRVGNGLAPVTKNAVPMSDDVEVIDGIRERSLTILLTKALQEALERIEQLEADHATIMNNNGGSY